MANETHPNRLGSFLAGIAEMGFGIEQTFFTVSYLFAAFVALQVGAIPVALAAFALSIAPIRAAVREGVESFGSFANTFRRG